MTGKVLGYTFSLTSNANNLFLNATAQTGPTVAYYTGDVDGVLTTNTAGNTNFSSERGRHDRHHGDPDRHHQR